MVGEIDMLCYVDMMKVGAERRVVCTIMRKKRSRHGTGERMMDDLISRQTSVLTLLEKGQKSRRYKLGEIWELNFDEIREALETVPSVDAVEVVRCKDCIYFELDHWVNVNGQPLIVAHEVCAAWGGGCKTKPDGYCNMGERKTNGNNTL